MRFVFTRDPTEFASRTEEFLAERLEHNILATVLLDAQDGRYSGSGQLFAYGLDDQDVVAYAALRTSPWFLLTSDLEDGLVDGFVERWLREDPELPGVDGPPAIARAIAGAWARLTGGSSKRRMREAMHELEQVSDPPRPADGQLRVAGAAERELLIEWMGAFAQEAGLAVDIDTRASAMVDTGLRYDKLLLWEDGGPMSMVGVNRPIAGVARVGPVYTPPEHRGRGYAGTAVAAASRRALAAGAERCMLFTDLANPTSNKIYAEVGYRRVGDWEQHAFVPRLAPA
jgi:RimJ/RimL family protein N-acetyltransferase